jgi:PAS domain S-box-containing protein
MALAPGDSAQQLHDEQNELIVERVRFGLGLIVAGVLFSLLIDHAVMSGRPHWAYLIDTTAMLLAAVGFWALRRPAVRKHPVPVALLIIALTCGMRALSGTWFGDTALTAFVCVVVALTAGAALPWGPWPQLGTVAIAGAAVAANAYFVAHDASDPPPHFAVAVLIPLAVSVVLSIELQRHRRRVFEEILQRRRAEDDLARLNSELELRVGERTAELAPATQRLEREALDRQQATNELHANQQRLQAILDNAPAAIHVKDAEGRYLLVNRHWETIFSLRRADIVGKRIHDVFPIEIADALRANDQRVLAAHEPIQVEETLLQNDQPHTFVSVKFPLLDASGASVGVCGISTDITERKHMEAELRRSEASLSALVENTTDAIWSVDRNGETRAMNAVYRERFRRRFGVEYSPAASRALVPPAIREDMFALYARAFAGEHVQVERTIPMDGEARHFLLSVHPIAESGVVTGATVFSQDITDRKRIEAQARQHQAELAHVLRLGTMGEMAAGLAHEINQPLGAIANYAQGCVRRLRDGSADDAALLPIVEQIAAEALRAGEIIRRLRELVRKESPEYQDVDLNGLVRKSIQMVEPEARQHGIHLHLRLAPDLPPAPCTGIQIEQVLVNLLLNGIEAVQGADNGERTLTVTTAPAAGGVEVAIRDSGVGIPEPPADVFAPFFSTKPNGLGMGLSISRSIIEAHGGRLWATRNADRGSTFRFTLPFAEDRATQSDRSAEVRRASAR